MTPQGVSVYCHLKETRLKQKLQPSKNKTIKMAMEW